MTYTDLVFGPVARHESFVAQSIRPVYEIADWKEVTWREQCMLCYRKILKISPSLYKPLQI